MADYTKEFFSESNVGELVTVLAVGNPGTLIHQAATGTSAKDEVWLYASCPTGTNAEINIQINDLARPSDITITLTGKGGLVMLMPGFPMNNAAWVRAWSTLPDVVKIGGFVNRITD